METVTKTQLEMKQTELENQLMMLWQFSFDNGRNVTEEQDNAVNAGITAVQAALTEVRKALKEAQ